MSNIFFNLTKIWWRSYSKCGTHTHTPHHMQKRVKKKAKGTVSVIYCLYNKPLSKLSGLRQQLFSYMCSVTSVASSSLRRHGPYPTVLLCPWIFQTRILEWVSIPFSRGSSWPREQTQVSHIAGRFFTLWATREATLCKFIPKYFNLFVAMVNGIVSLIHFLIFHCSCIGM